MWFVEWFTTVFQTAWSDFARFIMGLFGLCLLLVAFTGCSSTKSWDAEVKDGEHQTHWNWGLEIGSTFYIGPGKGTFTDVKHDFAGKAEGVNDAENRTPKHRQSE